MRTSLFNDSMPTLPDDAEVEEITRYTSGMMTPSEAIRFEERLTTDRAFFYRTAPMLKVWYARKPTSAEMTALRGSAVRISPAEPRAQMRRHMLAALGSAATMRELIAVAGIAAAVTFIYVMVTRETTEQTTLPPAIAQLPSSPDVQSPRQLPGHVSATVRAARLPLLPTVDTVTERVIAALTAAPLTPAGVATSARVVVVVPEGVRVTVVAIAVPDTTGKRPPGFKDFRDIANGVGVNGTDEGKAPGAKRGWRWPKWLDPRRIPHKPSMPKGPPGAFR
jgi:hypothetical protein